MGENRRLYLLRHAKSEVFDPARWAGDFDRPLSTRGQTDAHLITEYLIKHREDIDEVLCSAADRTRQTLAIIKPALKDSCTLNIEEKLYSANVKQLVDRLASVPGNAKNVMIIGHNPALHQLALHLAVSGDHLDDLRQKFPTSALAILELDMEDWPLIEITAGTLVDLISPRFLKMPKR